MKSLLGLGFVAALSALIGKSKDTVKKREVREVFSGHYGNGYGSPYYFTTNPDRKRKANRLRLSHNAKLKRRKAR